MAETPVPQGPQDAVDAAKALRNGLPWIVPNGQGQFNLGYYENGKPTHLNMPPRLNLALGILDGIIAGRIPCGSVRAYDAIESSILNILAEKIANNRDEAELKRIGEVEQTPVATLTGEQPALPAPAGGPSNPVSVDAPASPAHATPPKPASDLELNSRLYTRLSNAIYTASSFGIFSDSTNLANNKTQARDFGFAAAGRNRG